MNFKRFEIKDKEFIEKFTVRKEENNCEFAFYNLYIWQEMYGISYAVSDGIMFIRTGKSGNYIYTVPFGDVKTGMEKLVELSGGEYPMIWGQEGPAFREFKRLYGKYYDITELRDEFDYLYLREDLATLSGKKYHSKRNHISAFSKNHNWSFEEITEKNINEVKICSEKWYKENKDRFDEEMQAEKAGLEFILENFSGIDIFGGAIRADGEIVAFTFASGINYQTCDIYIEKALDGYLEAYTVINKEFAEKMLGNYKYINREDDLGLEGLRKAKLSYHPCTLVKKYICKKKDYKALKEIYKEAFEESPEFDEALFKLLGGFAETLEENGQTVSMLFKLPCFINGKKFYYIYAAATKGKYRNKGYMTKLLSRVREESDAPLFLVPSSKELVSFYEKAEFFPAVANENTGEAEIIPGKEQEQLSLLCDNCPGDFTVMFSEKPCDKSYKFSFSMQ